MHPWGTAGRMDLSHQVKKSMSQLESAPGTGQLEQPQEKGGGMSLWKVQQFCFGYLSLIFHAQGMALLLPTQPFLPEARTGLDQSLTRAPTFLSHFLFPGG